MGSGKLCALGASQVGRDHGSVAGLGRLGEGAGWVGPVPVTGSSAQRMGTNMAAVRRVPSWRGPGPRARGLGPALPVACSRCAWTAVCPGWPARPPQAHSPPLAVVFSALHFHHAWGTPLSIPVIRFPPHYGPKSRTSKAACRLIIGPPPSSIRLDTPAAPLAIEEDIADPSPVRPHSPLHRAWLRAPGA